MKMLQLPPTIRIARPDEVPAKKETLSKIEEGKSAKIIEGYAFQYNKTHALPFTFYAEINIDNSRLWPLFKALLLQLPEEICLVYNAKDDDPAYSSYIDKYTMLNRIETFELEITQDGLLEVGVLFNNEAIMEEIFIQGPKYVQYWGTNEERFRQTMAEFELYEIPELKFIDEYPLITESLCYHRSDAKDTYEVLAYFKTIDDTEM